MRAHQSAAAAQSAELLAANAYAFGEDVAFAEQPDLHTAAHEAAHVVQQRGGVQLSRRSGRSGRSGDAYEQHADAVADAVVAGESAEALLDAAPGGGGGVSRAVQRQDAEAATGSAGEAEGEEDPSPREQLEAALGGWGADQQEVTAIIRDASPAEKREMLGDAALMRKLAGAFDTEDMLTVLDAFEAPLTLELETAMRGWGCDAAAIKRLVAGAAPAERAAVLADAALVERLASELSQEDMLILLEAAGAPLDQRLSTAMNGWGCDAEAIRRLVTNATPAEKTALLADAALVERLASELSQEDMLAVLEQAGAPLAMRLNAAMSGWGCDAAAIKRLVSGATPADKAALLGDAAMVERLAGELSQEDMVTVLEQAGAPLDRRLTAAMDGWGCDAETIKRLVASATPAERAAVLADAALVERLAGELSQGDVLIVLGQVGAPLGRRLDAAMNGWGCDAEAVVQLVKGATPAEQAAVLADAALVERLAGELNRDAMSTVLEEIGAPLGQQLTTAMDGWGCDAATIVRLIRAAPAADQAAVAVDYALTTRLEDELPEADWHTVCRVLFDAANGAGDIATMRRLFESRFGVAVGSAGDAEALAFMPGGAEAAFGPNGLSRIYHLFETLPAHHVATLEHLMAQSTNHGGAAGGAASRTKPYLRLSYNEANTAATESGAFTDAGDQMQGMNILDTTTAHELSHRVDGDHTYSGKASFLALSGWRHHAAGAPAALRAAMQGVMTNPLPGGLTAKETAIAEKAAERALAARHTTAAQFTADVTAAYADVGADVAGQTAGADTWQPLATLDPALQGANLFRHITAGHVSNAGWFAEPFAYLPTRQFHEAYANQGWWSYLNTARTPKLSQYQFRDPGEMFSELYATYHCSSPKGANVPAPLKAWFEAEGLHQ